MRDENNPGRKENQPSDAWLASIARRFLHPIQLLIIDALWRSDEPYSARELAEILEGPAPVQIAYQMRGLRRVGAVEYADPETPRGRLDIRYRLVKQPGREEDK
jgi:Helix-turn-helix domain